jgi:hypothetical protein
MGHKSAKIAEHLRFNGFLSGAEKPVGETRRNNSLQNVVRGRLKMTARTFRVM